MSNLFCKMVMVFAFVVGVSPSVRANSLPQANNSRDVQALESLEQLLSIDRLHFYSMSLADFLDGKKSAEVIAALRTLTPENLRDLNASKADLNTPARWQVLIYNALKKNNPALAVSAADLEWNYNFYKNKLMTRFRVKGESSDRASVEGPSLEREEVPRMRSVPRIRGDKYLLDVERYIAEKTSRAIIWDAIVNDRDFEFHIGNQREFQELVERNNIKLIAEVQPMARNYNKIFLTYNEKTNRYAYIMNLISGDDRVKHLTAQLRLIRFDGKGYLVEGRDKVHVYGNALATHRQQEGRLLEIFNSLPRADKVVIGQKGAIDDAIRSAGMMEIISQNTQEVVQDLGLEGNRRSRFENLAERAASTSNFLLDSMSTSPVKIDDAFRVVDESFERVYRQFNSEQASHEFSDYLLLDRDGQIKRWRVFSAMWGDEIIPIAHALKKSGHTDIVYIGTAGAIAGRGIKVGDVIPGVQVQTHSGKTLPFHRGELVENPTNRVYTVGQVHTPFEETDRWLRDRGQNMDIVEVETGYLREILGENIRLQAYFLVSDVVGSEHETLAHAAQSASKRKRGQLRLLENLFVQAGIKAPISNFEVVPMNPRLQAVIRRLTELRPSRDIYSILQVAHIALRSGKTDNAQLEEYLKSQPAFERKHVDASLDALGNLLAELQAKVGYGVKIGVASEVLFNGTYNPKTRTAVKITVEGLSAQDIIRSLSQARVSLYQSHLAKQFQINFLDHQSSESLLAKKQIFRQPHDLFRLFEAEVLKRSGYVTEVDAKGQNRVREIPGMRGGGRCEAVFL